MRFNADPARYSDFKGSGELRIDGHSVLWRPPQQDAWLRYQVKLESRRESGRYDGLVTDSWAMFRADDLVPPVHLDMQDGTQSQAKLRLNLPQGWSVETPFPRYASGRLRIDNPQRLFDRPTGWIVAGEIGTRRETIGATHVTIAAPTGQGVRRMDMLAFLRWTVPTLQSLFPQFPPRLLVVSAGDPMWRGALSAPGLAVRSCRSADDQRKRDQHPDSRTGARRHERAQRTRCRLDRGGSGGILLARDPAPLRSDQRQALRESPRGSRRVGQGQQATGFGALLGRHHGARSRCIALDRPRDPPLEWRQQEPRRCSAGTGARGKAGHPRAASANWRMPLPARRCHRFPGSAARA